MPRATTTSGTFDSVASIGYDEDMNEATTFHTGQRVQVLHQVTRKVETLGTIMAGIVPSGYAFIQYDSFADIGGVHMVHRGDLRPAQVPLPARRPHLSEL